MKKSKFNNTTINLLCSMVIFIGVILFVHYYNNYIKPESYVIGTIDTGTYKDLEIKEYLSDENVLFSANMNDIHFSIQEGNATYDFSFNPITFDATINQYVMFVNNYLVSNNIQNGGTISGTFPISYRDEQNQEILKSDIDISFSSYTASTILRISLPSTDIPLLMRYFQVNDFIITLAKSPYNFGSIDGTWSDESTIKTLTIELPNDTITIQGYRGNIIELPNLEENTEFGNFDGWTIKKGSCNSLTNNTFEFANDNCIIEANFVTEYTYEEDTVDTSWFNADEKTLYIKNGAQLFGINKLIDEGVNLDGKVIKFKNNIIINYTKDMPELKGYNGILDGDNHNLTFNYNLDYLMNFSVFGDVGNNSLLEPYSFEIKNLNIKLNNTSETIKFIYPTLINGNINTLIITNCDFYDFYIKNSITSGSIYVTNCYFKNATQQLMNNANLYISQSEFEYAAFNTNYGFLKLEDCILKCATMSNYKPDNVDWTPLIVATNTTFTDMVVDKNVQGNIQLKNCTYPIIYKTSNDGVINIE